MRGKPHGTVRLRVERDEITGEWLAVEWSRHGEAIRGRYATEAEAFARLKDLQPPGKRELAVEEITDDPFVKNIWAAAHTHYKRFTVLFNMAENTWLVLGWQPGEYDPDILERCKTAAHAGRTARALRRAQALRRMP